MQPHHIFHSYLDAEQRLIAARVIKRFILHTRKSAFIVEHDFIMATYMADKVVVCVPPLTQSTLILCVK